MKLRGFIIIWLVAFVFSSVSAQLYTGLSGLINIPSAEMNEEGTARIGGYFMNKHFIPDDDGQSGFIYNGEKYHTADFTCP